MDIYREEILEHWQNPQNFGEMRNADLIIDQINPLCGDQVRFFFRIAKTHPWGVASNATNHVGRGEVKGMSRLHPGGVIRDVSFTGNGCAISVASASILSQHIKGKKISAISKITGRDVLEMIGGKVTPARLKCAFLALEAIKKVKSASS